MQYLPVNIQRQQLLRSPTNLCFPQRSKKQSNKRIIRTTPANSSSLTPKTHGSQSLLTILRRSIRKINPSNNPLDTYDVAIPTYPSTLSLIFLNNLVINVRHLPGSPNTHGHQLETSRLHAQPTLTMDQLRIKKYLHTHTISYLRISSNK